MNIFLPTAKQLGSCLVVERCQNLGHTFIHMNMNNVRKSEVENISKMADGDIELTFARDLNFENNLKI